MIPNKANSENLLIEKMPALHLCELIRSDIDLAKYMKDEVDCLSYLENRINEPKGPPYLLTEAIYNSDFEIVVGIWQYGGRNEEGDEILISLLVERLEDTIRKLQDPLNDEEKLNGETELTQIEWMILDVFRSNNDKPKLSTSLSNDPYFAFSVINLLCDQSIQNILNGGKYFTEIFGNFRTKISYEPENADELTHISELVRIGVLNEECVMSAFELFEY